MKAVIDVTPRILVVWLCLPLVMLNIDLAVEAYMDMRKIPCMSDDLRIGVPSEFIRWSGAIEIAVTCDPGYDWPLNMPYQGVFTCRPDGTEWDPPIFPDCNPLTVPESLTIWYDVMVPQDQCSEVKVTPGLGKEKVEVMAGDKKITLDLCDPGLTNCKVLDANVICNGNDSKINIPVQVGAATENELLVKIRKERESNMTKQFVDNGVTETYSRSSLTADCQNGTLGVDVGDRIVCRGCPLGHYADAKAKVCRPCPPGYFGDMPMQSECKECPSLQKAKDTVERLERYTEYKGAYSTELCPIVRIDKWGHTFIQFPDRLENLESEDPAKGAAAMINNRSRWTDVFYLMYVALGTALLTSGISL